MFEFFGFNISPYHIFNTILKAFAGLSLFPLIYFLFKNKILASIATILFAVHFTPFGGLNNVLIGEDSLVVVSINLFLTVYVWASQRHSLNNPKVLLILLTLFLAGAVFDVTRAYPFLMALPLIEAVNFLVNRSSTNLRSIFLRLLFLYFPFIAVITYSPFAALKDFSLFKLNYIFKTGNYQLIISLFASFGSTFVPVSLIDSLGVYARVGNSILYSDFKVFIIFLIFRYFIIAVPSLFILGSLALLGVKRFILRTLLISVIFFIFAFITAYHWQYLDSKIQAGVDPGTYFIPGLIGLFVFSTAISFFIEWLKNKKKNFLLALSLASFSSLLYIFLTWVLTGENTIFLGIHGYLNIAAIGSSIYLAIFLYLACQQLKLPKIELSYKIAAFIVIIYFSVFFIESSKQVDEYYNYWLVNGTNLKEQQKIQNSFWKEVGLKRPADNSPILIYLDDSEDYDNGYFYAGSLVWNIPSMLTVIRGEPFETGGFCKTVMQYQDFDKLQIKIIDGTKMITQSTCGVEYAYKLENFYAFKMSNRDLVTTKSEVIKRLEDRDL